MKMHKLKRRIVLAVLVILSVLFLNRCSTESREFGRQGIVGYTYEESKGKEIIKKDIISDVRIKRFSFGVFKGVEGNFLINGESISFYETNMRLKDEENIAYKVKADYKNNEYKMDITIDWKEFGVVIYGNLYNNSSQDGIKFLIGNND